MRNRKLNTRLPEDDFMGESPLDLLDASKTRELLSAPLSSRKRREEEEDEDLLEFDESGRMIIPDEKDDEKRRKKRRADDEEEEEEDTKSFGGKSSQSGGGKSGKIGGKNKGKVIKKGGQSWVYTGKEYAPKGVKTGGDSKKEGKLDPYAYWPLDPKMMNRRDSKKRAAKSGLSDVAKIGKQVNTGNRKFVAVKKGNKSHKGKGKGSAKK